MLSWTCGASSRPLVLMFPPMVTLFAYRNPVRRENCLSSRGALQDKRPRLTRNLEEIAGADSKSADAPGARRPSPAGSGWRALRHVQDRHNLMQTQVARS